MRKLATVENVAAVCVIVGLLLFWSNYRGLHDAYLAYCGWRVIADPPVVDVETAGAARSVTAIVALRNISASDVIVAGSKKSCNAIGCVFDSDASLPATLSPGEVKRVSVSVPVNDSVRADGAMIGEMQFLIEGPSPPVIVRFLGRTEINDRR